MYSTKREAASWRMSLNTSCLKEVSVLQLQTQTTNTVWTSDTRKTNRPRTIYWTKVTKRKVVPLTHHYQRISTALWTPTWQINLSIQRRNRWWILDRAKVSNCFRIKREEDRIWGRRLQIKFRNNIQISIWLIKNWLFKSIRLVNLLRKMNT